MNFQMKGFALDLRNINSRKRKTQVNPISSRDKRYHRGWKTSFHQMCCCSHSLTYLNKEMLRFFPWESSLMATRVFCFLFFWGFFHSLCVYFLKSTRENNIVYILYDTQSVWLFFSLSTSQQNSHRHTILIGAILYV